MPKYIKKKLRVPFHSSSANSEVCVIQDFFSMYILYMTFSVAILKKTKKKNSFTQRHSHKMSFMKIFRREALGQSTRFRGKRTKGLVWAVRIENMKLGDERKV